LAGVVRRGGGRHDGLLSSGPAVALPEGQARRSFATTVFNVKPPPGRPEGEQTLFIVGINEGKFFGQDSAEEALKLLERIAEHGSTYNLLFSLTERQLSELEEDHKVKNQRLTPSRELEGKRCCEFVPIMQAGMVDKCSRRALGRLLRTTQGHVAWRLWRTPREAIQLYWAYWRRKEYKNEAMRKFWMRVAPAAAYTYFEEGSELMAIRAVELLAAAHGQGKGSTWVFVVNNEFFEPVARRIGLFLDESAPQKLGSSDFSKELRDRASELCTDVPDLTPLLLFVYLGLPIIVLQSCFFGLERAWHASGLQDQLVVPENRE